MVWRKVLYLNQDVPDNYVDETFLEKLQKINPTRYNVKECIVEAGVVTQELNSVCLLVVVYAYLENGQLSPDWLLLASSVAVLLGYCLTVICTSRDKLKDHSWVRDGRSVFILVSFGFGLSPILHTLTETISTDTIYAMVVGMFLGYLVFHDYGVDGPIVSSSLSLNSGLFASVCLASRLSTPWHGFILLTVATETLALFPLLRKQLKDKYSWTSVVWTILSSISAVLAVATLSIQFALLLFATIIFLSIICPVWFVKWQSCKENIYGPWDEATPSIGDKR